MINTINSAQELQFLLANQPPSQYPTSPAHPTTLRSIPIPLSPHSRVHPDEPPISELLYSGFVEHLGRCVYGGIVDDYRKPSPAGLLEKQDVKGDEVDKGRLGWRRDVKALMGKGELEVPMIRWPGGNFVSNYHWQDGVGPIKDRPKRTELAWLSSEPNLFGTNEFIDYCRATHIEPFICLNMGTGTLEEALAWLEYCNGTGDSHWANLRRKHTGRDEPHNVRYWGLGNETDAAVWGPWQVGHLSATDYTTKAKSWAHALRLMDKDIKLVSCGYTGAGEWDREVLASLVGFVDLHSIHFYSTLGAPSENAYEHNVFSPAAAEKFIQVCQSLIDLATIERATLGLRPRPLKIAFDEWNVWDERKGNTKNGLEQWYDFTDMLGFVAWLHVLVRRHKEVALACLAQAVNVIAPIMTSPDKLVKQTIYYPLQTFSTLMKNGHLLQTPNQPDLYTGPCHPDYIQMMEMKPAYVDVVAMVADPRSDTVNDNSHGDGTGNGKTVRLSVLNRHPTADWECKIALDDLEVKEVRVTTIYSDDLHAANSFEHPEKVVPSIQTISANEWKGTYTVRKHSWAFFQFL